MKINQLLILFFFFLFINCKEEELENHSLPTLIVSDIQNINFTTSIVIANVSEDGGLEVTSKGVVWDTEPNPTINLTTKTISGSGLGEYSNELTGLNKGTKYYLRAYATTSAGTGYSEEVSFTSRSVVKLKEIKRNNLTHSFDYDGQQRLRKRTITVNNVPGFVDSLVFTYQPNKAIIKEYDSESGLYLLQEHILNSDGYSTSYTQTMFDPNNFILQYGSGSQLELIKVGNQTWYSFENQQNNMTYFKYHLGTPRYVIEYYTDKLNTLELGYGIDGDFYNSGFFLNHHPLFGKSNKNLIKKTTLVLDAGSSSTEIPINEFAYEFDADGDVKSTTITKKRLDGTTSSTTVINYTKVYF